MCIRVIWIQPNGQCPAFKNKTEKQMKEEKTNQNMPYLAES